MDNEARVSKKQRAATPTSHGGGGPGQRCPVPCGTSLPQSAEIANGSGRSGGPPANPEVDKIARHARRKPSKLSYLLDMPPPSVEVQEMHAWNPHDRSFNIFVKESDCFTFHRQPVAQSTDAIKGKVCYETGLHLFEFTWPSRERGTHAVVGLCTADAPVHCVGYQNLVGNNAHSWGWDLGFRETYHCGGKYRSHTYPVGSRRIEVPDKFIFMLDMDDGVAGFLVNGHYLGNAFWGLQGQKLFVAVSAVWGHSEVTMKYLGGLDSGPVALTHLCRQFIRKMLTKDGIAKGKIDELALPKPIRDFLAFREPSWASMVQ